MPVNSKPLEFNCPHCGRGYGSIEFLAPKKLSVMNRRKRVDDLDTIHIPKRKTLHPVEYSVRNEIIAEAEEKLLKRAINDLESIKLSGPYLSPILEAKKQRLEKYVLIFKQRITARQQSCKELRQDCQWDVEERSKDLDADTYELTRSLGGNDIIVKKIKSKKSRLGNEYYVIRWNPIKLIKNYRNSIDILRHIYLNADLYGMVLAKYRSVNKILNENEDIYTKAFEVINQYRKQFSDRNYRFTYFEWFWIIRYAQVTTPRNTVRMLIALDGKEGIVSTMHIKNKMRSVLVFWNEFNRYGPYFFKFVKYMHYLIEKDPQLNSVYNKIQQQHDETDKQYVRGMLDEHFQGLFLNQNGDNDDNDYFRGIKEDSFKVSKFSLPRVRIHHSNPYYQRELKEYEKKGRNMTKPKKKVACTFDPSKLPLEVKIRLHNERKVPIIDHSLINQL